MFRIENKTVGDTNPVYIIAEAGVNHNGDIKKAKELVDMAKWAGADAVKFQTFKTEKLVTGYAAMAKYQQENTGVIDNQYNMLKRLELSYEDFQMLKDYCDAKDIVFMSTPFDFESAEFLNSIGVCAFKISSGDLTNLPLLEYVSEFKKPIILSSGMATLGEVESALMSIYNKGLTEVAVLHCTSNYPARINNVNLKAMLTIKNAFNVVCGYSDHTEGILIPSAAAAIGANIIEKHFTLDKNMQGPDHRASLEPSELKQMVQNIRNIEISLGNGIKMFNESEIDTIRAARKSIVAAKEIKNGQIIKTEDIDFKRPGTGLSPAYYKDIIGKIANRDISSDEQISLNMVEKMFEV